MPDTTGAKPTCFIAMPITTTDAVAEKYNGDESHWHHVMEVLFIPAIEKAGYCAIPPAAQGGDVIHARIIKQLIHADMVLCDLSTLNANVMFEFGIRTALNRPIGVTAEIDPDFKLPFDTNSINTHFYAGKLDAWDLPGEIERLAAYITSTEEQSGGGNPYWHHFGLTQRAEEPHVSETPTEAKLDLLAQRLDEMQMQMASSAANSRIGYWAGVGAYSDAHAAELSEERLKLSRSLQVLFPGATIYFGDGLESPLVRIAVNRLPDDKVMSKLLPAVQKAAHLKPRIDFVAEKGTRSMSIRFRGEQVVWHTRSGPRADASLADLFDDPDDGVIGPNRIDK